MIKRLLAISVIAATALSASAEFRCGPTAGWNLTNYYWKEPLLHSAQKSGFQAGFLGEIMIPGIGFGVDFAARYAYRQASVNIGDYPVWSNAGYKNGNFALHRLEIPIHLRFKWTRMDGLEHYVAPFAFAGPVVAFNLKQSDCAAMEHPAGSLGLEVGIGGEFFEHFQLSASYIWGVAYDMRTVKLDNNSARSQSWNINVAYLF